MNIDMKTIGARIKARRIELGLKQTQIKDSVGISSGNLSEIENGNRTPSMITLFRLSEILNCSIDWIVKGFSSDKEKDAFSLSEDEKSIITYFRGMTTSDQEDFILVAEMKYNKVHNANSTPGNLSPSEENLIAGEIA